MVHKLIPIDQIKSFSAESVGIPEGHGEVPKPKPKRERKWRLRLRRKKS